MPQAKTRAKASAQGKPNPKGRRYTEAEKKKVLNVVQQVNRTKGRGGIAAAAKQFGVSALTISNWLRTDTPLTLSIRGAGKGKGAASILRRLADLHEEIEKRENELLDLRKQFQKLKGAL